MSLLNLRFPLSFLFVSTVPAAVDPVIRTEHGKFRKAPRTCMRSFPNGGFSVPVNKGCLFARVLGRSEDLLSGREYRKIQTPSMPQTPNPVAVIGKLNVLSKNGSVIEIIQIGIIQIEIIQTYSATRRNYRMCAPKEARGHILISSSLSIPNNRSSFPITHHQTYIPPLRIRF